MSDGRPQKAEPMIHVRHLGRVLAASVCIIVGLWGLAGAQDIDQQVDLRPDVSIPMNPRATSGTLDNGLRWFVQENSEPANRAELRLVVNIGSVLEEENQRGLAHFLEHMAFNGTTKYHAQALVDYLELTGMRFGPDINAVTSFDRTMYMLTVPTDDEELLDRGLEILAEWSRRIALDPVEIDKERGVVLEERRARLGSGQRVQDQHLPVTYHDSRYADRLPIGTVEVLESATADDLRAFYRAWYRPELMAVVAVGDFDRDSVIGQIQDYFDGNWGVEDGPERVTVEVPLHDETLFSIVADPENPRNRLRVQRKMPRRRTLVVGDYHQSLREILYDRIINERLYVLTQRAEPPFTSAFVGQRSLGRTLDAEILVVNADDGGLGPALTAALEEARRAELHGFLATELERAKTRLLRSVESEYAERDKTPSATYAGRYASHFLDGGPIPGVEFRHALFQEMLPSITLEELGELRRPWFDEARRVILASVPEKEGLDAPTETELRAAFAEAAAADLEPWTEESVDLPLVAEIPTPGLVVEEEYLDDVEITVWTLANGVKVFHKQTDFQDDQILMQAWSPGGSSLGPADPTPSESMAAYLTRLGGLGEFDRIQLGRKLAGKRAGVSPSISTYSEGINGGASPKDLETLLQLTYLEFTAPRADPEALKSQSTRLEAQLRNRSLVPQSVYSDSLSAILFDHHPWVRPLRVEDIPGLNVDEALRFYRDRFADANDFHFFFVGTVDAAMLRPLVERYLGSLPSLPGAEEPSDIGLRRRREPGHFVVRAGLEPKALTTLTVSGPMEWNREQRHRISSTGAALQIRLREVLREELSGTYGVSASASSQRFPEPSYRVTVRFGCDPARLDELVAEVGQVLAAAQVDGFEAEILAKVQEAQRRDYEEGLESNDFWIQGMVIRDRWGLEQNQILETPEVVDALTMEMVHDTAVQILNWEEFLRFDLLPADSEADVSVPAAGELPDFPDSKD
jgi:zinc protease